MAAFSGSERLERTEFKDIYKLDTFDKEVVVILLSGQFSVNGNCFSRSDVFSDPAQGFCAANSGIYNLQTDSFAEICIVQNKTRKRVPLSVLGEKSKMVGENNFSRNVKTIADKSSGLDWLIVGETIKPAGNWSSWPPHKHDKNIPNVESQQKEIYLYKFENSHGFGVQILYDHNLQDAKAEIVTNNKEIKIHRGYHPVVTSPYSGMYYLWALFGDNKNFNVSYEEVDS